MNDDDRTPLLLICGTDRTLAMLDLDHAMRGCHDRALLVVVEAMPAPLAVETLVAKLMQLELHAGPPSVVANWPMVKPSGKDRFHARKGWRR